MPSKITDLNDTDFISRVASDVRIFFVDAVNPDIETRRNNFYKRAPLPHEAFSSDVLLTSGQLINAIEQMNYATGMLSGFRNNGNSTMTRYDYIVFQMENHALRSGMLVDRCLKLVNSVYNLGNAPTQCKFDVIAKNAYASDSTAIKVLKSMRKRMQDTQSARNTIAHYKSYDHDDLRCVGIHSTLLRSGVDETTDRVDQFIKTETDNFVAARKKELSVLNEDASNLIIELFDSLIEPYKNELRKLA